MPPIKGKKEGDTLLDMECVAFLFIVSHISGGLSLRKESTEYRLRRPSLCSKVGFGAGC